MSKINLIQADALHLVKAHPMDSKGNTFYGESKFQNLAFKVRNSLVNDYGLSESRIDSFKLEKSFKNFGDKAKANLKDNGDFSDFIKLEKKCFDATIRNIKAHSFMGQMSKEERIAVKTVIREIFAQYGVI